jgi:hypothetical protein
VALLVEARKKVLVLSWYRISKKASYLTLDLLGDEQGWSWPSPAIGHSLGVLEGPIEGKVLAGTVDFATWAST